MMIVIADMPMMGRKDMVYGARCNALCLTLSLNQEDFDFGFGCFGEEE